MMKYQLNKGTVGKLIEMKPGEKPLVKNWTLRDSFQFVGALIDDEVIKSKVADARKIPVVRLEDGYALFGGDSGIDRKARFVFAVPYAHIKIL